MKIDYKILPFVFLSVLWQCSSDHNQEIYFNDFQELELETSASGESNMYLSPRGDLYLSWIEYVNDSTDVLQYSVFQDGHWQKPSSIASGTNWFTNWADFPAISTIGNGNQLIAHWLQKSAEGTYDYDINMSIKSGNGTWLNSFIPHRDSIAAEHGFVSMVPWQNHAIMATWLDGRNTKSEKHDHGHGGGPMTIRSAIIDSSGIISAESEIDARVCDCCQTSLVASDDFAIVAYRDRSETEIRDISFSLFKEGKWSKGKPVYQDDWKFPGCPVNGPALAMEKDNIAIAWYTESNETPTVKVAFFDAEKEVFHDPVIVDSADPLGRVDLDWINENQVTVSWMEEENDTTHLRIRIVNANGKLSGVHTVSTLTASRRSGFPRMQFHDEKLYFSWTETEPESHIRTGVVSLGKS